MRYKETREESKTTEYPMIIELPLDYEFNGSIQYLYPSLVIVNNELTLVDTGYPNFLNRIENEIIKNGYSLNSLKNVIITHYDIDHIGSIFDIKAKYPWVNIIASEKESKYISGEVKSERLQQAEDKLVQMTDEEKEFGRWFIQQLRKLKHVPIDKKVSNGELILNGQCEILATSGHTSGHISLYFPSIQSVITGDAAIHENDKLVVANPHFCLDIKTAELSLRKLINLDAETYYCYHGGKYTKSITL